MLINTSLLEGLLDQRRKAIDKYNSLSAQYHYDCWNYATLQKEGKLGNCCGTNTSEPTRPLVRTKIKPMLCFLLISFCSGTNTFIFDQIRIGGLYSGWTQVDALSYYKKQIIAIDKSADKEYCEIVKQRLQWRDVSTTEEEEEDAEQADHSIQLAVQRLSHILVPSVVRKWLGEKPEFFYETGMVQFKSTAAKQSGEHCTLLLPFSLPEACVSFPPPPVPRQPCNATSWGDPTS